MSINNEKNFDCVAAARHIHEFLDGELSPELHAAMERHLTGCADCASTLAQLQQIEKAHQELDTQLAMPAEAYWQALPQRVMERVKASEKRRLLKLPRLKSLHKPTAAPVEQKPPGDLLYLSPAVRKFLGGPVRYVLPLAAVAAFCFFIIRDLREKPASSIMTASSPQRQMADAPSRSEPIEAAEKPVAAESAPAITKRAANVAQPTAGETFALRKDTALGNVRALQGAGGGQSADLAATTESGRSLRVPKPATVVVTKAEEAKALLASNPQTESQLPLPSAAQENRPAEAVMELAEKAKDEPAAPPPARESDSRHVSVATKNAAEAQALDDQLAKSTVAGAKKPSPEGRAGISALSTQAAFNPAGAKYAETRQRADQTADLKKREKIWHDFLKSQPDSSHRAQALLQLAQTISAASDSTTKTDRLEKNFAFFRANAGVLRQQMGAAEYERELARLQMLLNFRKSQ
jgi:anti-sigma factor RsiW